MARIKGDEISVGVRIRLNRLCSNGPDDDKFALSIVDDDAVLQFFEATINIEGFANLLSNREVDVVAQVRGLSMVGTRQEIKTETVPFKKYSATDSEKDAALKKFEVDGWVGDRSDLTNGHRYTPDGQRVTFFRNVPKPKPEKEKQ